MDPQQPAYIDESCWHVDSKVMRYIHDRDAYEVVCMRDLSVGDEVLVRNPELKTLDREKIIRIHDHGREKHAQSSKVRATKLTILPDDGSQAIKHVLAASHYMLT